MQSGQLIHIFWDFSHIWGLMLWRALRVLGFECRLTTGREIIAGVLFGQCKQIPGANLLIVPGGNARLKARSLGVAGLDAIRNYLATGGNYLGFCGGAGLALTCADKKDSLGLCPWQRAQYPVRLQHLISGHIQANLRQHPLSLAQPQEKTIALPVWWPGRFAPEADSDVQTLATCSAPDADFWLADLPLQRIPSKTLEAWQSEYGLNLTTDFLADAPLVISGTYGLGRYVLSYSHLETPASHKANSWFAHLVSSLSGLSARSDFIPDWQMEHSGPHAPAEILQTLTWTHNLLNLGTDVHLFFRRTPWLWGWRRGLPGIQLNCLHTALATLVETGLSKNARSYWLSVQEQFSSLSAIFVESAQDCLLTYSLAESLFSSLPDAVDKKELQQRANAIFGDPMNEGGLLYTLLHIVEKMLIL